MNSRAGESAWRETLLNTLFLSASLLFLSVTTWRVPWGDLSLFCRVSAVSLQRAADDSVTCSWVMADGG